MKRTNGLKAVIVSMIVVATILFAPLAPIYSAMAQTNRKPVITKQRGRALTAQQRSDLRNGRALYHTDAKPGTRAYYEDDDVRYSAVEAVVVHGDFFMMPGGDPQVDVSKGEQRPPLLEDEERVPNDIEGRNVITMSRHNVLYIAKLPKLFPDGTPVYIVRNKFTKKMYYIEFCVNWARDDVGTATVTDNTCVGHEDNNPKLNYDEKGNLISKTYDFGCGNVVTVLVEVRTVDNTKPCDCIPGSYTPLLNRIGNQLLDETQSSLVTLKELKKAKEFSVKEVSVQIQAAIERKFGPQKGLDVLAQLQAQKPGISTMPLVSLHVGIDPCELGKGNFRLLFEGVAGNQHGRSFWGKFKWFFIIAIPALAVLGIILTRKSRPADLIKTTPTKPRVPPKG